MPRFKNREVAGVVYTALVLNFLPMSVVSVADETYRRTSGIRRQSDWQ